MTDSLGDLKADIESDAASSGALRDFVGALREANGDGLRAIARYDSDDHELLYLRADLREQFSEEEQRERVKTFVLKGLADPKSDAELADYGDLDATLRWFDNAVLAIYPTGEWSGVIATFDRRGSSLVDAVEHLD